MSAVSGVNSENVEIDRAFVRLPWGEVHLRRGGPAGAAALPVALPLFLAHSGPGSSAGLLPLLRALGRSRDVVAPDLPGLGDSAPLALDAPQIADYADAAAALLDRLGLAQVDFYGQHTGAQVGLELALRHPARVRRIVLDGLALFDAAEQAELLAHYAPVVHADAHGGHLAWAWAFVRELGLHFPHYRQDPAHRLHAHGVPPPAQLQALVLELLKALPSYHLAYRAAFAHPLAQRLPWLGQRVLLLATAGDPLARYLDAAAALLPRAARLQVAAADRARAVAEFLDAD